MTAPTDVEQPPAADPAWDQRPIVGNAKGLPWWGAVLLAFGVAAIAAWVDMNRQDSLSRIYQGAYILGCVIAVCAVRRRNLFGPMVQPPLVFAITAVGAVVLNQPTGTGSGLKQLIFSVALPLTSNFPTMAVTTGVTVAIGLARLWFQRDPNPRMRSNRRGGQDPDPMDALDARRPRPSEPPARTRDRSARPGRTTRTRGEQDPAPRQRPRPNRSEGWDQPPPRRREPPPDRAARGDRTRGNPSERRRQPPDPRRRSDQPRRRPPDDFR